MQSVFYVMAILGCGDGNTDCTPARFDQARFATMAECRAQLPAGLARNSDLSYPVIAADCRRNSPVTMAKAGNSTAKG
ncbi:hypothetical protein [Sphingomonas bacterium]|uniref:hypothetical protein n=1 Tax=Sphingomonas bacterium TaxID=1895847 RepID=UPI0015753671|nr:hypothetical protein [Sphingomonas bacterium]